MGPRHAGPQSRCVMHLPPRFAGSALDASWIFANINAQGSGASHTLKIDSNL